MGTRCGDIDPAIHFYLCKNLGLDYETLEDLLNRQSGLLGLCGVNDMREIQRLAEEGDDRAELAIGISAHRLKKYIGAYYAELGRVDAIVFTGGIGENAPVIRSRVCRDAAWLGVAIDEAANAGGRGCIGSGASRVAVWVIPTNEELMIARHTRRLLETT
jgi:acetate kinase